MKTKRLLIPLGLLTLLISIFIYKKLNVLSYADEYYKSGIYLKGIILEKKFIQKDAGLYEIKIIDCNVKFFDPRKDKKEYNLIINNNQAEFICNYYSTIQVGDAIILDFIAKEFTILRNDQLVIKKRLNPEMPSVWYPSQLKKMHKL